MYLAMCQIGSSTGTLTKWGTSLSESCDLIKLCSVNSME